MLTVKQTDMYRLWERRLKDPRTRAIVASRVDRLSRGLPGDVAPVGHGVTEMRIHIGPGYRIYFSRRGSEIILLLCGGDKSSQARDIALAQQLVREWNE